MVLSCKSDSFRWLLVLSCLPLWRDAFIMASHLALKWQRHGTTESRAALGITKESQLFTCYVPILSPPSPFHFPLLAASLFSPPSPSLCWLRLKIFMLLSIGIADTPNYSELVAGTHIKPHPLSVHAEPTPHFLGLMVLVIWLWGRHGHLLYQPWKVPGLVTRKKIGKFSRISRFLIWFLGSALGQPTDIECFFFLSFPLLHFLPSFLR